MDTHFNQKRQQEQEQETTASARGETSQGAEFATTDEMFQRDRDENPPPPEIAERLNQSLANEPKRGTSFWTRLGFKK